MRDPLAVHVVEGINQHAEVGPGDFGREPSASGNVLKELPTLDVLENDGETFGFAAIDGLVDGLFPNAVELHNVWVSKLAHNVKLVLKDREISSLFLEFLDGELLAIQLTEFNLGVVATPKGLDYSELIQEGTL